MQSRHLRLLFILLILTGCNAFSRTVVEPPPTNPELESRLKSIDKLVIASPDIKMYEIGAGGIIEPIDEWNEQAKRNMLASALAELRRRLGTTQLSTLETVAGEQLQTNLQETRALLEAVENAIIFTPQGQWEPSITGKWNRVHLTVGREVHDLAPDARALLFIQGTERRSTAGRKAMQAGAFVVGLAGAVVGAPVVVMLPGGTTPTVSAAIVDTRDGRVLWYNRVALGSDLRLSSSAEAIITELFKDLPVH
jgi:hypothetical protein